MNSKLLSIVAIGFTALFLSAQAFACGGAGKDKDVRGTAAMQNYADSGISGDRDINGNSQGLLDQSEYSAFDVTFPAGYAEKDKDAGESTIKNDADKGLSNDRDISGNSQGLLDQSEYSVFDVTLPAAD